MTEDRIRYAEPGELALLRDDGILIRGPGWRCVADVMRAFHGFSGRIYGVIVDAETLVQVYPQLKDGPGGA